MYPTLILAAALAGQQRMCQTAASYYRQQQAVVYAAPAYRQAYAATYATTYAQPYLEVKFAPVIREGDYYAGLIGGEARAAGRREAVVDSLDAIRGSIDKLTARIGQPAPQPPPVAVAPPPVAPAKPTPDVPAKPEPPAEPPPLPKTNPEPGDNGDVPPPPPVPPDPTPPAPNPSGAARLANPPNAAVTSIFVANCGKCHTAPAKAGKGFVMFTAPGKLAPLDGYALLRIDSELFSGEMPKDARPLEPKDYTPIRVWINENKDVTDAYLAAARPKVQ
jgi:hypothetical protein